MANSISYKRLIPYLWLSSIIFVVAVIVVMYPIRSEHFPETCMFSPGISCQSYYLTATGSRLDITLVNGLRKPITVTGFKCTAESDQPTANWNTEEFSLGVGDSNSASSVCYKEDGTTPSGTSAGSTYSGKLWLRYYYTNEGDGNIRYLTGTIYVKAV